MTRVRIARASRDLIGAEKFYRQGLQFTLVDRFVNHAGYSGVILAMPGEAQLEITQHARGRAAKPDADDLLVLYLPTAERLSRLRMRLERLGHASVQPANPYWLGGALTFEDPDGWRIVLCHSHTAAAATRLRNRGAVKSRNARNFAADAPLPTQPASTKRA
jgi:catechol 2,3-dioxygenase-like lactoylglutathione lyase family enzyme